MTAPHRPIDALLAELHASRGGLTTDEARRRLEAGAGSQFDPSVVAAFVRLLEQHGELLAPA